MTRTAPITGAFTSTSLPSPRALDVRLVEGQLHIDGQARLVIGGELHNSGASSPREIERAVGAAAGMGVEVVLAPVAWEQLEPEEGVFDFTLVDVLLQEIRARGLQLIPLWFGTWKNGMSTYVPRWVKQDRERFPRIELPGGERIEAVSPFSGSCRDADARAFAALTRFLADRGADVVVMLQVENELGTLGAERDHSALAEQSWSRRVPSEVTTAIASSKGGRLLDEWSDNGRRKDAPWSETLQGSAPEAFMASAYACYVEAVATAGRAHLSVPMFVNAWLDVRADGDRDDGPALAGGVRAGEYPSGGPLRFTAPIWRALAPSIDFLAPDIYAGSFDEICSGYRAASGSLFIPEMRCDSTGVAQMFRAIGEFGALGVSPFAIDAVGPEDPHHGRLQDGFRMLRVAARLLDRRHHDAVHGFVVTEAEPRVTFRVGDHTAEVVGDHQASVFPPVFPGYGMIIVEGDEHIVIGRGFAVRWLDGDGARRGFLEVHELDDADRMLRRLNGDEAGGWLRMPALDQTQTELLPIRQNLRSSGIVRVSIYSL